MTVPETKFFEVTPSLKSVFDNTGKPFSLFGSNSEAADQTAPCDVNNDNDDDDDDDDDDVSDDSDVDTGETFTTHTHTAFNSLLLVESTLASYPSDLLSLIFSHQCIIYDGPRLLLHDVAPTKSSSDNAMHSRDCSQ